jgi:hypothetical protein
VARPGPPPPLPLTYIWNLATPYHDITGKVCFDIELEVLLNTSMSKFRIKSSVGAAFQVKTLGFIQKL